MNDFLSTFAQRYPLSSSFAGLSMAMVLVETLLRFSPTNGLAALATFVTVLAFACLTLPILALRD